MLTRVGWSEAYPVVTMIELDGWVFAGVGSTPPKSPPPVQFSMSDAVVAGIPCRMMEGQLQGAFICFQCHKAKRRCDRGSLCGR